MNSLRQKITYGYYAVGVLIVLISLFSFVELRLIENKILAGQQVSDFFDTALEIRRFEKNYFLYRQGVDAVENTRYVEQARNLLRDRRDLFEAFSGTAKIDLLESMLNDYGGRMDAYSQLAGRESVQAEEEIRKLGQEIVAMAELIARSERVALQASLARQRMLLLVLIGILVVVVAIIGQLLMHRVAKPLSTMQAHMEAVASGKLMRLDMPVQDREMASLVTAFNHVLRELELRHVLRSEKLASLGTLLSGVAHELNNPLSNISSSCQILIEDQNVEADFRHELLKQIDEQTLRARNIVRALLDFARDRTRLLERLNLAEVIAETLRFLKGQIPTHVTIQADIPAGLSLHGDRQHLQQVFLNLVKNALDALDGMGEVRISATGRAKSEELPLLGKGAQCHVFGRCEGGGAVVDIEVRDNGPGIPPELLPRIFDPFFTTKDVGKGSGLGLFVVYRIVEEYGGCIAVESEPGKGCVFYVRLPVNPAADEGVE